MTPYLGSIMVAGFGFPPKGWQLCNGQILQINQWQALFSLLGTYYGGNGVQTFALPNLQGRVSMGMGAGYGIGQLGGEATHTLITPEMPTHRHTWKASTTGPSGNVPTGMVLGATGMYNPVSTALMSQSEISFTGGGQGHENRSPFLVLNFCLSMSGIYPTRS